MWLRLRYSKHGPARFTSTRDFGRAFERALRRAGIPMAYSSGFNPHPRISYANGAPTGSATSAEYVEIGLAQACDPEKVRDALNDALPPGMRIEQVAVGREGFGDSLSASEWLVRVSGPSVDVARQAVAALLASDEVTVSRMGKSGMRTFDVRAAVVELDIASADPLTFRLISRQGSPLVRPEDVLSALALVEPAFLLDGPPLLERVRQGPLDGDTIGDPLA